MRSIFFFLLAISFISANFSYASLCADHCNKHQEKYQSAHCDDCHNPCEQNSEKPANCNSLNCISSQADIFFDKSTFQEIKKTILKLWVTASQRVKLVEKYKKKSFVGYHRQTNTNPIPIYLEFQKLILYS